MKVMLLPASFIIKAKSSKIGGYKMETIQSVLDNYFASWNEGFISKDGDAIKQFMSSKFIGYWAHSNIDEPEVYGYDYDINGVLKQTDDTTKSFEISSITSRKNGLEYLISGKEMNLINGTPYCAQCMFIWRKEQQSWKLLREYIELER